jgi:hypothetical protein
MHYLSICPEELRETLVRRVGLHGEILIHVLKEGVLPYNTGHREIIIDVVSLS